MNLRRISGRLKPGLLLAPTLAVALLGAGCSKPKPVKHAETPLTLTVTQVVSKPMKGGLAASGNLVSREEAGVASELAGYRIGKVFVDEDAWVKQGQPLAQLDDTLLRSQIAQQKANLNQQEVAAQRAQGEADRVKGLDNAGVLSQEQIAERRLAAKSGQASVNVAKAQLQDLMTRDARLTIRAPVTGRVLQRMARPGDTSAAGTTLFTIARDGLVELDAGVAQDDLADIKVGDAVTVTLPSGEKVGGRVRFISPRVDETTGLGHVRVALPVRPDLRPGGYGQAVFASSSAPKRVVPEGAIHFDANGASLMVVDDQNRVHRVPIVTGERANGLVEILQGPPVGSRVALGGGAFVLDGDKITPVEKAG